MMPPHMSLKCTEYRLEEKEETGKSISISNDVQEGWCLWHCVYSISACCIYFCFPSLKRQPSGTSLNGLKGLSGFNDASERACCYSSTQILLRDFAMPLGKSEHYEHLGI